MPSQFQRSLFTNQSCGCFFLPSWLLVVVYKTCFISTSTCKDDPISLTFFKWVDGSMCVKTIEASNFLDVSHTTLMLDFKTCNLPLKRMGFLNLISTCDDFKRPEKLTYRTWNTAVSKMSLLFLERLVVCAILGLVSVFQQVIYFTHWNTWNIAFLGTRGKNNNPCFAHFC